ncbi:glycosyltransferase family 1 protein [Halobacteriales archaeon QS_1_68_20]|nr:MAG: glycosyltransferase family 1 protein [Halobacteriales archaeon QS_1_68_20]
MHVGFVVYGDLSNVSGGFLYDRELVEGLRQRGEWVDVVSLPWRTYGRHLTDNFSDAVRRRLDGPHDVLLQDELCHPSLVRVNRSLDVPVVALAHSLRSEEPRAPPQRWLYSWIERRYLGGIDGAVCNSRATREAVETMADVSTTIAYPGRGHRDPGVTTDEIERRAHDGPLRVAFLGNVVPRKGLHALVDGLAGLDSDRWHLTVVGSLDAAPRYASRLGRRLEERDLADSVTLTGHLSDDELAARLRDQHVLAVPSLYEAFGIVYLEGMGFGLPALATTAGGADELVRDGENGFLVPPEEPLAIARTIAPLVDDRDRLAELGVTARETYEAHQTWDETVEQVRTFLRDVRERAAVGPVT